MLKSISKAQNRSLTIFFDSLYNPIVVSSNVGVNSRNSFSGTANSPAYYSFKVWFVICIRAHQGATRITLKCRCNAIVINKLMSQMVSDRSLSVPRSVLHLKVDKVQGLRSGILVLFNHVLLVQWMHRQELKLFYSVVLNCLIKLMSLFINDFNSFIVGRPWDLSGPV